ncbi:hypothetical protein JKF63_03815 [Porcisia hertigi]|uniref:Uncharacterized protein n=1 Tax=Porcisia hertigi TaxID=2761500 RepID=A0A836HQZ9_9TRYP|nr:hypothetical protein JKF63_03815 [Porcisia hertigi]
MTKVHITDDQQLRVKQVHTTHQHLKELTLATQEALKYHGKYLSAWEKVMNCLSNNSKDVVGMHVHVSQEAAMQMQSTAPTTARLLSAHNNWCHSGEMKMMRAELESLQEVSATACGTTRKLKKTLAELQKAAKKCTDVNSPKYALKISTNYGKSQEKLLRKKREANANMAIVEDTIQNDMRSLATSWSATMVERGGALYAAFAGLGYRMASCFPVLAEAQQHGIPLTLETAMPPPIFLSGASHRNSFSGSVGFRTPSASASPQRLGWATSRQGGEYEDAARTLPPPFLPNSGKLFPL